MALYFPYKPACLRFAVSLTRGFLSRFLLAFFLGTSAFYAASPAEYKGRVESARFKVEVLLQSLDASDENNVGSAVAKILSELPASEKIDWPGGSIETQNGWLAERLKEFTDRRDEKMRRDTLVEISERLLAISESAGTLEKTVAGDRGKDQDKQKLDEILRREEYQKPELKEESIFQKWWREFQEWLAKMFPRPDISPGTPSGLGNFQFVLQILLFVILLALIAFILYRFAPFLSRRFGRRKRSENEDRVILGERIGADESSLDLFTEAERLARDGNVRAAIRKGYIALLCDLSDRKIVRLARHKTNRDYLGDVGKDETLLENMRMLTHNFETNWYGLRTAEDADWEDFRALYETTVAHTRRR